MIEKFWKRILLNHIYRVISEYVMTIEAPLNLIALYDRCLAFCFDLKTYFIISWQRFGGTIKKTSKMFFETISDPCPGEHHFILSQVVPDDHTSIGRIF